MKDIRFDLLNKHEAFITMIDENNHPNHESFINNPAGRDYLVDFNIDQNFKDAIFLIWGPTATMENFPDITEFQKKNMEELIENEGDLSS